MNDEHPAARLRASVKVLRRRSKLALAAFVVAMLPRAWDIGVRQWLVSILTAFPEKLADVPADVLARYISRLDLANRLLVSGSIAIVVTTMITAVFLVRWMRKLVSLTMRLGAESRWTASQATWAFFLPFINLVRPYQILFHTMTALAPSKVEQPPPRVDRAGQADYRGTAFVESAPERKIPPTFVGAWWAAWLFMNLVSQFASFIVRAEDNGDIVFAHQLSMLASAVALAAAVLGMTVVSGLTARLEERFRRIRASTVDSLDAQGIDVR